MWSPATGQAAEHRTGGEIFCGLRLLWRSTFLPFLLRAFCTGRRICFPTTAFVVRLRPAQYLGHDRVQPESAKSKRCRCAFSADKTKLSHRIALILVREDEFGVKVIVLGRMPVLVDLVLGLFGSGPLRDIILSPSNLLSHLRCCLAFHFAVPIDKFSVLCVYIRHFCAA